MVQITILDITQDQVNKSIIVKTNYVLDGVEVPSTYPKLNDKYYWQTRYNLSNFAGMTDAEIRIRIFKDLVAFAQQLIRKAYFEKVNYQYIQSKSSLLINQVGQTDTADILVDTNGDNVLDTKWIVKSDGTRTEEPYTPPSIP